MTPAGEREFDAKHNETAIVFSQEELVVVADAFRIDLSVMLGAPRVSEERPWATLSPEVRPSVERGLVARGAGSFGFDGTFHPLPVLGVLLEVVAAPSLVVQVQRWIGRGGTFCTWAVTPELVVAVEDLGDGLYRIAPSEPADWFDHVIGYCVLVDRPLFEGEACRITLDRLTRLERAPSATDRAAIVQTASLDLEGERTLRAFAAALDSEVSRTQVEMVYRATETVLAGGELAWVDGGAAGLWTIPVTSTLAAANDLPDLVVDVAPTSASSITDELRSYLPDHVGGSRPL